MHGMNYSTGLNELVNNHIVSRVIGRWTGGIGALISRFMFSRERFRRVKLQALGSV